MANTPSKAVRTAPKSRAGMVAPTKAASTAKKAANATARGTVKGAPRQVRRVVDPRKASARSTVRRPAMTQPGMSRSTQRSTRAAGPAWTTPVLALGSTQVPNALLAHHLALGLDAKDVALLLHLWRRWDTRDGSARCSVEQLARESGIKRGGVKRRLGRMQAAGLLQKRPAQTADDEKVRRYAFGGLVQRTVASVTPAARAVDGSTPIPRKHAAAGSKTPVVSESRPGGKRPAASKAGSVTRRARAAVAKPTVRRVPTKTAKR